MDLGIGVLAFFLSAALIVSAVLSVLEERRRIYRGLRTVREMDIAPYDIGRRQLATAFSERVALPAVRRVGRWAARFTPTGLVDRLNRELTYAGQPAGWDAERVIAVKIIMAVGLGGGALILGLLLGGSPLKILILAALLAVIGFLAPDFVLSSRYHERQEQIRLALADALDVLSITVEAGLGFDAAVARVSREVGGPLGEEFQRVLQEMQLGKARTDAFRDLAERSTLPELKSFVLAMIQADIFGIAVSKVLQVQAREMRIKRRQAAEERAQKLPVKILFPMLLCIFPALFVVLLGPAAINVFRSFHSLHTGP